MQNIVVVTGSSGLVGQAVCTELMAQGYSVRTLVRRPTRAAHEYTWYPERHELDTKAFAGAIGVIHLAGRNIAARWTETFKATMLAERTHMVQLLHHSLRSLPSPPPCLVVASAIGIYPAGESIHTEASPTGPGWLASVSHALETPLNDQRIRQVYARLGVVLSRQGGALAKMLPAFQLGLGGPVGTGSQRMSVVSLTDTARALVWLLANPHAHGAYNVVAPELLPQRNFATQLGQLVHRPTVLPMPAWVVKLVFGEMGQSLLLADLAVQPQRLLAEGFIFRHPTVQAALCAALKP